MLLENVKVLRPKTTKIQKRNVSVKFKGGTNKMLTNI